MDRRTRTGLLLDCYGALLTNKQRAFMSQRFEEDLSLAEIAEKQGVSRQAVRDALMRGEAQLEEYEDKLGYMERDIALARMARELMEITADAAVREELARLLERIEGDGV
ncbi:MAG TPA: YlxM family DNA-binding protein [Clostridia bacterium]|nr:YlxM family DNA-binding protein [Clostridia bacterium]